MTVKSREYKVIRNEAVKPTSFQRDGIISGWYVHGPSKLL